MIEGKKSVTVLIVDDDPDSLEGLRVILESRGINVIEAKSASECLETAREYRPDLMILDIMMETKSAGFDVCYQIRKDPVLRDLPVILLSALPEKTGYDIDPEIEERYLPVERFLAKPLEPDVLFKEIERLLGIKLLD
jgi:two-component system alkaline phosphatase synthesis response regulator PhoP